MNAFELHDRQLDDRSVGLQLPQMLTQFVLVELREICVFSASGGTGCTEKRTYIYKIPIKLRNGKIMSG